MKKVLASITKYVFAAFGIAVLGLLMSLTYQALQRIFPNSFANQIWGLVLFDIAAVCWAACFVFNSETTQQYAVAAIGFIAAFIGTLTMVGAEVLLSGQSLVQADPVQIGQWLVYGFIGTTILHAALLWGHTFGARDIREKIDVGIARGEIISEALHQATNGLDKEKAQLAHSIAQDIASQVKRDLGLVPAAGTIFEPKQAEVAAVTLPTQPLTNTQPSSRPAPESIKDEPTPAQSPFPQ
jgi:hypothetical membrane protein